MDVDHRSLVGDRDSHHGGPRVGHHGTRVRDRCGDVVGRDPARLEKTRESVVVRHGVDLELLDPPAVARGTLTRREDAGGHVVTGIVCLGPDGVDERLCGCAGLEAGQQLGEAIAAQERAVRSCLDEAVGVEAHGTPGGKPDRRLPTPGRRRPIAIGGEESSVTGSCSTGPNRIGGGWPALA